MMKGPILRLLSYKFDGDPEKEKEFNDWYNNKHIVHALSEPEYLDGYRYRNVDDPHEYLTVYFFESEEAIQSMLDNLKVQADSENTKEWLHWSRTFLIDYDRKTYRQIYPETPTE